MERENSRTVIFDLDGTLLDTLQDLANALNYALALFQAPACPLENVRRFVGNGIDKLVERALAEGREHPHYAEIVSETRAYYSAHCTEHTAPYPGITELLSALAVQGFQLAVVSNKPDKQVKYLCDLHFGGLMCEAVGNRPDCRLKPAPDALWDLMKALRTDAPHTVYVGDSDVDVLTARNAGIPCISVLWGFRGKAELTAAGAVCFAENTQELEAILTNMPRETAAT